MRCPLAVAVVLTGLSASWVSAQVPAGGEFQVNTFTAGMQTKPSAASDAAGNVVVAWESQGPDGSYAGVVAQRYDASGMPRGGEFLVNTHTTNAQLSPKVVSDAAGNFVVAWSSQIQDGSMEGIFAQRFDAAGQRRGSEFQINTYTTSAQVTPALASNGAGDFVAAWTSWQQDGSSHAGIFGQRFDAAGQRRGSEFQVNTFTTGHEYGPAAAMDPAGNFVVVWTCYDPSPVAWTIFGQRYDAAGAARGGEFAVSTTTGNQRAPSVTMDPAGGFAVVWQRFGGDGNGYAVVAQRFDAAGQKQGGEFQVNSYTTSAQYQPSVFADAAGNFVVSWTSYLQDGASNGVFGQRFDASGTPRGGEFQVNTYTTDGQYSGGLASDAVGNFVVTWDGSWGLDGNGSGIFARRFGGLQPAALAVDSAGNGVLEPGETIDVRPSWKNVNGASQSFGGAASSFSGPSASGVSYQLTDAGALYGTVDDGVTAECSDCYQVQLTSTGARPAAHWDAALTENITPDTLGQVKRWSLHVGDSFTDVPRTSGYYRFIETLLHNGVTGGCSATEYCPGNPTTRDQMAIFALVGKEGSGYSPSACTTPMFGDVPATSPFCRWVEELASRGVVGGCGGGNYCPTNPVTRGQMAIFMLKTLDPALDPPACGTPMFGDLPASSPYCRWVEDLANRGVVSGCGGGNYCPNDPVTRGQMGVFISATFGLTLYGP